MFKLKKKDKLSVKAKGISNSLVQLIYPIKYEVRISDGNWSPYFGKYQNQKWGAWDSDSCWCLSSINCTEDQLEWLWKNGMFSPEAKNFFTQNGYIDSDGDFSLSERFHEILCGNKDTGGTAQEAWQSFKARGFLPRSQLTYSPEQANKWGTQNAFNADYFNQSAVTQPMRDLAKQSLKYLKIDYQTIGKMWITPNRQVLQAALKQAPLNYGIPIPVNVSNWNVVNVQYDGSVNLAHEVEGYYIPDIGPYYVFDQYLPNLKTLSTNYYLPTVYQGIITATTPASVNPVPQPQGEMNDTFWTWVMNFWNGIFGSPVPIGSS